MEEGEPQSTLGGTRDIPESIDAPAEMTQQSESLKAQVKDSTPWDVQHQRPLLLCYTKQDWVTMQNEAE